VFGVRDSLIAPFPLQPAGTAPDGSARATPYYALSWDFVLRPAVRGSG
jgi:hydroxyquinol 1,2-dioxygenase